MIFYYSGCGNSAWAAKALAERLNDRLVFIPKADSRYEIADEEAVGFVFPVYSWAPPELVTRFVKGLTLSHTPKYVYMVCTCGDEAGLTDRLFAKALARKGWPLNAAYSIQMPETYINLPGFKLDTTEGARAKQESAMTRIDRIAADLKARRNERDVVAGSMSWLKSVVVKWLFYKVLITDRPFRVKESCVGCGICAKNCPVGNIRMEDGRPQWQHRCVGCMSCYHRCPQNAIQWGRQTEGKGQYYYKNER